MIGCLLFEADRLQVAKDCDVRLRVTGWVGEGEANVTFRSDGNRLYDTVLYLPALLHHRSGAKTRLSLTKCCLKWSRNGAVSKTDDLTLTKSNWRDDSARRCKLSLSKVKSKVQSSVVSLSGALSPDDFMLHVGDLEEGTELSVAVEFVFRFQPSLAPPFSSLNCVLAAMMPCAKITMTVDMTSIASVKAVESLPPSSQSSCSSRLINNSTVSCILKNVEESTLSGIVISCSVPVPLKSFCFSLLLDEPIVVPIDGTDREYQGVQMLSSFSHGNRGLSDWHKLSPCEMLFLVDCSGSMSGKKIHCTSESLILAIKSLPPECTFNIVAFGSKYRILFPSSSMEASPTHIEDALRFANQLQACLGGTDLLTPIKWLLKKPVSTNLHRRQLFLITDGGIPNESSVLHAVRKYKNLTRCHTFTLGPDVSAELMSTMAYETDGHFVVVDEETRLQTKVMEVVKLCLQPPVTDVAVSWSSSNTGYTVERPFQSPPTVWFPGMVQTCFTTLTKAPHSYKNGGNISLTPPTVTGFLSNERVQAAAELNHEKAMPLSDRGVALLKNAAWFKMQSLNDELLTCSKNKRTSNRANSDEPPPSKKPKLNGSFEQRNRSSIIEEIIAISLTSKVSFYPYTHFQSSLESDDAEEQEVCQLLPWNGPRKAGSHLRVSTPSSISYQGVRPRKRSRHSHNSSHFPSPMIPSLSSIAKRTVSSFSSAFKTAVNIATFGLVNMEESNQEGGERIEDQVYYQTQEDRIHWDEHNRLVLPKCYYKSHSHTEDGASNLNPDVSTEIEHHLNKGNFLQSQGHCSNVNEKLFSEQHSDESTSDSNIDEKLLSADSLVMEIHEGENKISEETHRVMENEETFEEGTADSSIYFSSVDNFDIRPDYMGLVQLQLPSGAWPLVSAISPALGIPMATILKLPTNDKLSHSEQDDKKAGEVGGDIWASLLALTCLKMNFEHFKMEWDLLVMKGEAWFNENKDLIPLSASEAKVMAASFVPSIN